MTTTAINESRTFSIHYEKGPPVGGPLSFVVSFASLCFLRKIYRRRIGELGEKQITGHGRQGAELPYVHVVTHFTAQGVDVRG